MKLFVTGAAGFIGSNYVRWLLNNSDDQVTIFDKLTYAGNLESIRDLIDDKRCRFVQGDICDADAVLAAMNGHDAVVHFAAESHVDRSIVDPYAFVRTNAYGTNVMCDVARQVGVQRFLHISTDEVYGSIDVGSFRETDILGPRSPYSASKASSACRICCSLSCGFASKTASARPRARAAGSTAGSRPLKSAATRLPICKPKA